MPGISDPPPEADPLSPQEFTELYRAHFRAVHRYVERRVDDPGTAAEIASAVFELVYQRDAADSITLPWLYRVASNKIGDHYRRRERRRSAERAMAAVVADASPGLPPLERLAVVEAIGKLPQRQREAVYLTYYEGLRNAETAQVLGCSESAVSSALTRAMARLRHTLTDLPIAFTGGSAHELA